MHNIFCKSFYLLYIFEQVLLNVLVFLMDRHLEDYGENIRLLDSGTYACIYLDNFNDEISCALRLRDYCRENGYALDGDYICEELTEFNVFDMKQRNMYLRLQVPVRFQK